MLELEHGFRVVDVNARLDPDSEAVAARGRDVSPDRLERELHQAGVVRAVVSPGARDADRGYLRANNAVARLAVDRPFLTVARINGPRDPGKRATARLRNFTASRDDHHTAPDEIEQYAYDDRFHGFYLNPGRDGLPDEDVLDRLDDVDLPVLVSGGESFPPGAVAETLLSHSFPVILAHFGGDPLNRELMATAIDLLEKHDELYLDTSRVRYRDLIERALREHPDRVLFGSGAPEVHPDVGVMEILTLDVSEDLLRRALSKNAARVIPGLSSTADA